MKYRALLHTQASGGEINLATVHANFELEAPDLEDAIRQIIEAHPDFDGWLRLRSPVMGLGDKMDHVRLLTRNGRARPVVTRLRSAVRLTEVIAVQGLELGTVSTYHCGPDFRYEWAVSWGPDERLDPLEPMEGTSPTYNDALDALLDRTEALWKS